MRTTDEIYDVAVVGGGLCGFAAARTCALSGLKTLVVEPRQVLGWESAWAFALDFAGGDRGTSKWLESATKDPTRRRNGRLDAPALEILLDGELARSGASLLLYAQPVGLAIDDDGVSGVAIGSKSGQVTVRAAAYVDATENALLWGLAGAEVTPAEPQATFAVFLAGVSDLALPQDLSPMDHAERVELKAGVWPGEVAVEFTLEAAQIGPFRLALPQILQTVREQRSEFAGAIVTHVSVEPFTLQALVNLGSAGVEHPKAKNLFAAGVWATAPAGASPLTARLDLGDALAEPVINVLPDLKRPEGPAPSLSSVVAPPVHETEVLVCGGGTAGAIAAIAAGRQGAKTTMVEASTFLGGIGSGGGIHIYYHGVAGGIQDEVDERVEKMTPLFGPPDKVVGFHPEVKKAVLHEMAVEAGVDLVFQTTITGAETEDLPATLPATGREKPPQRLRSVVVAGPDGAATYRAECTIDSTGDGDVAYMAGAPFTYGRETDNLPHAYSLAAGRVDAKRGLVVTNFDAGYCDPTDIQDLTRARRRGLEHYRAGEFTAENRLAYIAPLIGLRNSRQIVGEYRLTFMDEIMSRQFPDVIGYAYSHYDNHGSDYENESDETMLWVWALGNWRNRIGSEIPYRCLVPLDVEALLVACRAISITHDAHNQLRMQRDMQRLGEAAGVAAAICVEQGILPRQLPVPDLQAKLLESGALGPREQKQLPAGERESVHDPECLPAPPAERPIDECLEALGGDEAREATLQLCLAGQDAIPALIDVLDTDDPDKRFWASVALAMHRREEAVPALVEAVESRRSDVPEKAVKAVPLWMPAAVLLGRIGDADSVPALTAILKDKEASLDALVAAVRALGRVGAPACAPDIDEMLAREDLPTGRPLQNSTGAGSQAIEDCRWQLELAAAETLAKVGTFRSDIVGPHLADQRAYVRRYAEKVERFIKEKEKEQ